jgi:hypothetical protein
MGKDVYLQRLGEVNGEIQNCTRSRTEDLAQACPRQVIVPSGTSYAVFTLNIAQALISIANGEQEPGLYTMVSDPEIAWKALGHYYLERANLDAEVVEAGRASPSVVSAGLRVLTTLAERYRNEISSYLTFLFPGLENRLRLERFRRAAAAQVGAISSQHHRLFSQTFVGRLPGRRLGGLCTDWETTRREMRSFREELRTRGTLCRHAGESFGTGV